MSHNKPRTYTLFPTGRGFSNKTGDYRGQSLTIVAHTIRQAYGLAFNDVWALDSSHPVGIVESYEREGHPEGWHELWCGCRLHGGIGFDHAQRASVITAVMRRHETTCAHRERNA